MPFRERLKKTFSRNSTSGDGSSTVSKSSSRQNSNIYQPGEKIPYKYRRPVAKDHKDKLNAFSFAGAWRRQSNQSQYSPMGSRLPSRRGSIASAIRKSIGNRPWNSNAGPVSERLNGGVSEAPPSTVAERSEAQKENENPNSSSSKDYVQSNDVVRHDTPFTQEDLTLALQRSHLQVPAS